MRWLDRLLLFCVGLVVAANLLPLGARWSWMLELTTHFRVQYLAATAAVLVLAALRRRWGACVTLVAAGAVSAAAVFPYLPSPLATVVCSKPDASTCATAGNVSNSISASDRRRALRMARRAS
jgi:hypothetical protein